MGQFDYRKRGILFTYRVYMSLHTHCLFDTQGIGDSGQGIVNGFLFCILTPKVRQKLFSFLSSILCCLWLYHNCCKERLRLCCPTKDGYSTIHSMASVDLQGSSSTSFPILKQSKRYSSCTVSVTSASSNEELSHAMCQ